MIDQLNIQSKSAESETFRKEKAQKQRQKDSPDSVLFTLVFKLHVLPFHLRLGGKFILMMRNLVAFTV